MYRNVPVLVGCAPRESYDGRCRKRDVEPAHYRILEDAGIANLDKKIQGGRGGRRRGKD